MKCPKCSSAKFKPFQTMEGVEVDFCDDCHLTWFENCELAFYVETAVDLPKFADSLRSAKPTRFKCPACPDSTLVEIQYYPPQEPLLLDYCPQCKGLVADQSEIGAIEGVVRKHRLVRLKGVLAELRKRGFLVGGTK